VKRTLLAFVLGGALLVTGGVALADSPRPAEPRWGIRPERTAPVSALDLARWMARRLIEAVGVSLPVPSDPVSAPVTTPTLNEGDAVCPPERVHCPMG
jgi:hypothetical protein